MIIKALEIRDEGTCIPVIAIKMIAANDIQDRYLWRCGYPRNGKGIVLMQLSDQQASSDLYEWGGRTMPNAHNFILEHFDDLEEGAVVDVQVILEETTTPVSPEIYVR